MTAKRIPVEEIAVTIPTTKDSPVSSKLHPRSAQITNGIEKHAAMNAISHNGMMIICAPASNGTSYIPEHHHKYIVVV